MKSMTYDEVVRRLERDGWIRRGKGKGSHRVYSHPRKVGRVVVAYHRGKSVKPGTLRDIAKAAGWEDVL